MRLTNAIAALAILLAGLLVSLGGAPATAQADADGCFATRSCVEEFVDGISDLDAEFSVAPEFCTIVGTEGDDVLRGTGSGSTICGLGGDDQIFGTDGVDIIFGGDGNDRIYGGGGNDVILTGAGDDVAYGGDGNDRIMVTVRFEGNADAGRDRLIGGAGDDELAGGYVTGGNNSDAIYFGLPSSGMTLIGGPGVDRLTGSKGDDRLYAGGDGGYLSGQDGDDLLVGAKGDTRTVSDRHYCRDADSVLPTQNFGTQTEATNVLIGGTGDDVLVSGGGRSCMGGNDGSDTFYGSELSDVILAGGTVTSIGSVASEGGQPEDRNRIYAKGGDDIILASVGVEIVYGAGGDDIFTRIPWRFPLVEPTGGDVVRLGDGDDILIGGLGDDRLNGGPGSDSISGGEGDDFLWPGDDADADELSGEQGDDRCFVFDGDAADATCESVDQPGQIQSRPDGH